MSRPFTLAGGGRDVFDSTDGATFVAIGYVKLHRESMEHAVFADEWLWKVFCWCIMRANFRDGQDLRGSFTTGRFRASEELNATPSRVYEAWKRLEKLGCITAKANSQFTTITVCNYTTYQSDDDATATAKQQQSNNEATAKQQRSNTDKECKEGKKDKKGRTNVFVPPTVEEVAAYCRERNNGIDAEHFVSSYAAKGWMVGRNKMIDWKAAVVTWEKNSRTFGSNGGGQLPFPKAKPRSEML